MILTIYFIILLYYAVGTAGIYVINRKKEPSVKRKAWIKHINFFIIANIVFFSIAFNPIFFRAITILIIIRGFYEIFKLYHDSGFNHRKFFLSSVTLFALLSAGFYFFSMMDKGLILFSFLIISIFDGFSQISGQLIGRKKLIPKTSPDKTVEGFIGGTLIALFSAFVFKNLINDSSFEPLLVAGFVVIFSFAGDTVKSIVKRKYNTKDFSNLIPGHGGFLDRFDSLIATGAGLSFLSLFINL